jgi:hypothetical protein
MEKSHVSSGEAQSTSRGSSGPQEAGTSAPLASGAGDSALQVNGAAVVTTATLGPGMCRAVDYRYVDLGDGTVLDCNTEKIWLKDASCLGQDSWDGTGGTSIFTKVAGLNGGTDFSCAGYTAGTYTDWEVPTMADLCGLWNGSCTGTSCCTASQGIVDTSFSNPTVANAAGDGQWMWEDAFVAVHTSACWSASVNAGDAWAVSLFSGTVFSLGKDGNRYVWPVRGEQ